MINLNNVSKKFDNAAILKNVNLSVENGEFVIIKGESGRGKSTLLNIMSLLEPPTSGAISFNGKTVETKAMIRKLKKEDIAYIYQNYGLIENKTVFDNLTLPLNVSKKDKTLISKTVQSLGLSKEILSRKVFTCSGGEQQRIAIARTILKQPSIIFADEPTGNLDKTNAEDVIQIFKDLNREGVTIVMATHDSDFFDIGTQLIDLDK
ncbi:putative ABC transport system ATP-binding protein [Staphylococcus auricularis]|uniref:ABC transporter ATP-binding protein n=1 Tax=Staphylococcus auricularis TaxID=29379 RepID=A0AAW7M4V7_9STAP|nr:ABC transporter ATP-binding protein [Staphylococcus auricularis]MBM0867079.1 ABC transporter ATP-binding protein [Staphylococcus auricularis]MCG7342056.1 ABC transporter ATP-binding protein [Staphylococcus auricularis]MDC6327999.1 ABC transporter ATP-binding protein [Staphylococcus auricularis]MDN4532074.1 ABC transporter ATP-binding protein [Staphylococcus auricularis]HJE01386.1 ABC transporter ATP-binding protein [Staphylococcus auricularis]